MASRVTPVEQAARMVLAHTAAARQRADDTQRFLFHMGRAEFWLRRYRMYRRPHVEAARLAVGDPADPFVLDAIDLRWDQ